MNSNEKDFCLGTQIECKQALKEYRLLIEQAYDDSFYDSHDDVQVYKFSISDMTIIYPQNCEKQEKNDKNIHDNL